LKENFIQDIDYQCFVQNDETASGGFRKTTYLLTLSCLEFFIARKVRPVFEVYRAVFHRAATMRLPEVQASQDRKERLRELLSLFETSLSSGIPEISLRPVTEGIAGCVSSAYELKETVERMGSAPKAARRMVILDFLRRYGFAIDMEDPYEKSYNFYKDAWDDQYRKLRETGRMDY